MSWSVSGPPGAFLGGRNPAVAELEFGLIGFPTLSAPQPDRVVVPDGYTAEEVDPRDAAAPAFRGRMEEAYPATYHADGTPDAYVSKVVGNRRYVARFHADRTGEWRALPRDGDSLAADAERVGGTRVARSRCVALHPVTREVYVALTSVPLGATGPIVRCLEGGSDAAAPGFRWSCLRLSGDARAALAPHGLWFDGRGVLWIKTDVLLAADPVTGHVRRFLAAPRPGGITDVATTTDARTLFVTIQYGRPAGAVPPRTATLAVRRADAGVVGG